jgi:hypothetical protein
MHTVSRAHRFLNRLVREHGAFGLLVVLSAIILVSSVARFIAAAPVQVTDLNVPPTDASQTANTLGSSWVYSGLGTPNHASLYLIAQAVIGSTTHNPAVAQSILTLAPLLLAPITAFFFFRRIGLQPLPTVVFAVGYELSPWLAYNFLGGEPLFTWLFALLPLVLFGYHEIGARPSSWGAYVLLCAAFVVGVGMTLQAMDLYVLFAVPSLVQRLMMRQWRGASAIVLATAVAASVALIASVNGIPAYTSAAAMETGLNGSALFAGFRGANSESLRVLALALAGLLGLETLLLVSGPERPAPEVSYGLGFGLVGTLATVLLVLVPGDAAYWIFTHIPILTPFLNVDKFVLVAWLSALVTGALLAKQSGGLVAGIDRLRSGLAKGTTNHSAVLPPRWAAAPRLADHPGTPAIIMVGVLVVLSIAIAPPNASPVSLVAGGGSLEDHQIPPGYFAVQSFLLHHGVDFGFGPRTLVLPTNPGQVIPFYVATTSIPGYLRPSPEMVNISAAVAANDSGVTKLLALLGVEYLVVPPTPADPWWPSGASGPPTAAGIAPGAFVAQGDPARYVSIFHNWSVLTRVFNASGFSVYANHEYAGPVYAYANESGVEGIASGRDWATLNETPTGVSVVANPTLTGGTNATSTPLNATNAASLIPRGPNAIPDPGLLAGGGWRSSTSGNASLLANGTFVLSVGSRGISASERVNLTAGACDLLAYNLTTHPGYSSYPPPNANRTYLGLYWTAGAVVLPQVIGNASGRSNFAIRIPSGANVSAASVIVHAEPPLMGTPIYTKFSNLSLRPVACSDIQFPFLPANWTVAFGNGSIARNGTLSVPFGSHGFSVEQSIVLRANATYSLRFDIVSQPAYPNYPPTNIHQTYAAVYWAAGGAVSDQYAGPVNRTVALTFRSPPSPTGHLNAILVLSSEAPIAPGTLETQYRSLGLFPLDGRDLFSSLVRPVPWTEVHATEFRLGPSGILPPQRITLPIAYAPGWTGRGASGASVPVGPGPLGLVTLNATGAVGPISLSYSSQSAFLVESSFGLAILLVTSGTALVWAMVRWRSPAPLAPRDTADPTP